MSFNTLVVRTAPLIATLLREDAGPPATPLGSDNTAPRDSERQSQNRLLRDVFGNPFRPVSFDPAWRTPNVVALAQTIYTDRELPAGTLDLARLAVLSDALEEAGCDSEDILAHCRGEGPHVRGCWAVDLLLGKE